MHQQRIRPRQNRRGSIYVVTVSSALIVTLLATTALTTVRLQRREGTYASEIIQAASYAEGGFQVALTQLCTSTTWRSDLASGKWGTHRPIADGYYTFIGSDPVDNVLTNSNYDPVNLLVTGRKGSATQKLKARCEIQQPGVNSLLTCVYCRDDLTIEKATVNSPYAPIGADTKVDLKSQAVVRANVESRSDVAVAGDAQLIGTSTESGIARVMPSVSTVVSNYSLQGTAISITSLPLWDRNYLTNPGAESGIAAWTTQNCTVTQSSSVKRSGNYSFFVNGRALLPLTNPSNVCQDITSSIAQNVNYTFDAWVYTSGLANLDSFRITVKVRATGGDQTYSTPWVASLNSSWKQLSGSGTITWSGSLLGACWYVESQALAMPYYFDDCVMKETGAVSNTRVIHRALLSPQSNPFTGITNTNGIYVINCSDDLINIRDSRIQGTLILKTPKDGSKIEKTVFFEPAVSSSVNPNIPNHVVLVSDKRLDIALESGTLSERLTNRNFNPVEAPYYTATDTDTIDEYPSQINGILMAKETIYLAGYTTIEGTVLGEKKIEVIGTNPATTIVTLRFNGLYAFFNPPTDFRATPAVSVPSGAVSRAID